MENIIISFYAKGMSVSDIEEQIREMYDFEVSTSTISRITNAVASEVVAWQNRPLDVRIVSDCWMDGIVCLRKTQKSLTK